MTDAADETDPTDPGAGDPRSARSAARLAAVQALYQLEMSSRGVRDVVEEFVQHRLGEAVEGEAIHFADEAFFTDLVKGVVKHQTEIDRAVNDTLAEGWRLERLDSILRALMRTATYELLARDDVPAKVVINEYIDLGHAFFEKTDVSFVNGALDALARRMRGPGLDKNPFSGDA